jgi:adhesin transport system membrane fusion protein
VVQASVYGVLSERVAHTELEIEQIDSQLDAVQINYNTKIYRERSQVTGEIAELEVRLPAIRQRLNKTEIRSPIEGIVNCVFLILWGW